MGGTGGAHSGNGEEQHHYTELMIMHKAADAIREQYIEEPSVGKSMFNAEPEDISVRRGQSVNTTTGLFLMTLAFICFGLVTISFKAIYLNYRHTIWEDIYGRGVGFFVCSTLHYLSGSGT